MTITPNSIEYNLLYSLAIILLIATFLLACYLAKRVFERKQERGKFDFKIQKTYLNFLLEITKHYFDVDLRKKFI